MKHTKMIKPKQLYKKLYEAYKDNMTFYGKPILPYQEWQEKVLNTSINEAYVCSTLPDFIEEDTEEDTFNDNFNFE